MGDELKTLGQMTKEMRDARLVRFEERILRKLKRKYAVDVYDGGTRYVVHGTPLGTLILYPEANKVQIREVCTWHKQAVRWMYKNRIIE